MKKAKLFALSSVALLLSSCGQPTQSTVSSVTPSVPTSSQTMPSTSDVVPSSEAPLPSSEAPAAPSSEAPLPSSEPEASIEPSKPGEPIRKQAEVRLANHYSGEGEADGEYTDTFYYDENWFFEDSSALNYGLATISAAAGGSSYVTNDDYQGKKARAMLETLGYSNIKTNTYYGMGMTKENSVGAIIGSKKILDSSGNEYTLLAIMPRNANYGAEWYGNFVMGDEGIHEGFKLARDEMLRFLKSYISTLKITGNLKFWVSGYSRGAAVANLLGGFLDEESGYFGSDVSFAPKDVFVYTIGCPRNIPDGLSKASVLSVYGPRPTGYLDTDVPAYAYEGTGTVNLSEDRYKGIHNFIAYGDYVTKLPFEEWGFSRYGDTKQITYGSEAFREYLAPIAPDTASSFEGKDYVTPLPKKEIDVNEVAIVDSKDKVSIDAFIEERLGTLKTLAPTRAVAAEGYAKLMGAAAAVYGLDGKPFLDRALKDISPVIKAGVLAYISHAAKKLNVEGDEAFSEIVIEAMKILGKEIADPSTYTDQQLLSDLLDVLINDPVANEKDAARMKKLAAELIPAPYGELYLGLLDYAKTFGRQLRVFDDLFELLASYIHYHKEDKAVDSLLSTLAAQVPADTLPMLGYLTGKTYNPDDYESTEALAKAAVGDILELCVLGKFDAEGTLLNPPAEVRVALLSIVCSMAFPDQRKLTNLLVNGANGGDENYRQDAVPLKELMGEVLALLLPKGEDEKTPLPLEEGADEALAIALENGKGGASDAFITKLQEGASGVRDILIDVLLNPGKEYSLKSDIDAVLTFIENVKFFFPAHYHELYISFLKTQLVA